MERFFKNYDNNASCKLSQSSPTTSAQSSAQKNKNYDQTKRSRSFVAAWKTEFPWAVEVEKDGGNINMIVCSTCRKFSKLTEKPSGFEFRTWKLKTWPGSQIKWQVNFI